MEKLFDFLKKLFRQEKKERKLLFEQLLEETRKEFEKEKQEKIKFCLNKFSEIKYLIKNSQELVQEVDKIKISQDEGSGRLRKIVDTSKKQLSSIIKNQLYKLVPPNANDFEKVKYYCINTHAEFSQNILSAWKNIAITNVLVKDELKNLGEKLQELEKILNELRSLFSDDGKISKLENLFLALEELHKKKKSLQDLLEQINIENVKKNKNFEKEKELLAQLKNIKESPEAIEQQELEKRSSENLRKEELLKNSVLESLHPVSKEMQRLQKLSESGKHLLEKDTEKIIDAYLTTPLLAIKLDPSSEKLKKILKELLGAVKEGKISIKEKDKEEKIKEIENTLTKNFFEEHFLKLNEITAEKNKIEKELGKNQINKIIKELEKNLDDVKKELNENEKIVLQVQKMSDELKNLLTEQKLALEEKTLVLGQKTNIMDFL